MKKFSHKKASKLMIHWIGLAESDKKAGDALFQAAQYRQCLFFSHLYIEKLLKAQYLNYNKHGPPFSHELPEIAKRADVQCTVTQMQWLNEINEFNIQGRYPDYHDSFFKKKLTKRFCVEVMKKADILGRIILQKIHLKRFRIKK